MLAVLAASQTEFKVLPMLNEADDNTIVRGETVQEDEVQDLSMCFRISFSYLYDMCIFGTDGAISMRLKKFDRRYGGIKLKNVSTTFLFPSQLKYFPRTWYHFCIAYDGEQENRLIMRVNDFIMLNETLKEPANLKIATKTGRSLLQNKVLFTQTANRPAQ